VMAACIAEPISWLRLERHALGERVDATIDAHCASCEVCRACLNEIRGDLVPLRPLPASAPRRRWWVVPSFALGAAVATILVLVLLPRTDDVARPNVVAWKGGELVVGLVRERGGAIADDATTFVTGDRWKVVITCPPAGGQVAVAVEVFEVGGYSAAPDRPLPPAQIACGNRVALPGAFSLTGARPNRICVRIAETDASACLTVAPQK